MVQPAFVACFDGKNTAPQDTWFVNLHTPHLSYLHSFKGLSTYLHYPNIKIYTKSREFTTYSDCQLWRNKIYQVILQQGRLCTVTK